MGGCQSGEVAVEAKIRRSKTENEKQMKKHAKQIVSELWKKYDTDKSGFLEFNELRSVVVEVVQQIHGKETAMYFIPSHESMRGYFKTIDADGSGEVSRKEFIEYVQETFEESKCDDDCGD